MWAIARGEAGLEWRLLDPDSGAPRRYEEVPEWQSTDRVVSVAGSGSVRAVVFTDSAGQVTSLVTGSKRLQFPQQRNSDIHLAGTEDGFLLYRIGPPGELGAPPLEITLISETGERLRDSSIDGLMGVPRIATAADGSGLLVDGWSRPVVGGAGERMVVLQGADGQVIERSSVFFADAEYCSAYAGDRGAILVGSEEGLDARVLRSDKGIAVGPPIARLSDATGGCAVMAGTEGFVIAWVGAEGLGLTRIDWDGAVEDSRIVMRCVDCVGRLRGPFLVAGGGSIWAGAAVAEPLTTMDEYVLFSVGEDCEYRLE